MTYQNAAKSMTTMSPPIDKSIWDTFMSQWQLPSITVALELGLFDMLHKHSSKEENGLAIAEIADDLSVEPNRGLRALLEALHAQKYLLKMGHGPKARFWCTEEAVTFLVRNNPEYYWGNMLVSKDGMDDSSDRHCQLRDSILKKTVIGAADEWEAGELTLERAKELTSAFHSHSLPSAMGAAAVYPLDGVSHLLDIGGGSGCYSMSFAKENMDLHATVMDLPSVCKVTAENYFAKTDEGVKERLHVLPKDMFRDAWPSDDEYDAIFFSNIFHDWSFETCKELLKKSFDALPFGGGRVILHETLLDSNQVTPAFFSVHMAVFTRGQQFYFDELKMMMEEVGFIDVKETRAHGYYSIVSAEKP
jgi:acetylserotonin N-methyltransferase